MSRRLLLTIATVGLMAGATTATEAAAPFDPLAPCAEVLAEGSDIPILGVGYWAFGFLDAATGEAHEVTTERLETMVGALIGECRKTPDARMYDLADKLARSQVEKEPTVAEAGRALLMRFFDPGEDLHALTQSLRPSADDVRKVYGEPLATALIDDYDRMFTADAVIGPKPEHKQLLTTFTTTFRLKAGDPVLDEFPGGYKEVLEFIVGDVPIGRFKFVEEGETLGLAFDGLIHVNGHWVLMPKPWRMLPEQQP